MLLPALGGTKEQARRTSCRGNLRQFYLASQLYAADNRDWLPSGAGDLTNRDEHIPVLSPKIREAMISYAGDYRVMECPGLGKPFGQRKGWLFSGWGYVLGYNYLGVRQGTPWEPLPGETNRWVSPQRLSDSPNLTLFTDMNDWSPGYQATFAPHGAAGAILKDRDYQNASKKGAMPQAIGAVGGNLCLMNGSVFWRKISKMRAYRGSYLWEDQGCYAMW